MELTHKQHHVDNNIIRGGKKTSAYCFSPCLSDLSEVLVPAEEGCQKNVSKEVASGVAASYLN